MTAVVPLNEGEILVPMAGSVWAKRWKEIKLVNTHRFKDVTYWWCEMTDSSGITHLDTMSIGTLRSSWVRKPSFYKVGKTYKFRGLARLDTWKVLEVYAIENSAYGDKAKAVAKMVTPEGLTDIQTLSQNDFDRMVEV